MGFGIADGFGIIDGFGAVMGLSIITDFSLGEGISIIEVVAVVMFFIGFFGLITGRGVIKSIVSIAVMEASIIMFLLSLGYTGSTMPPIGREPALASSADPLPQALVITAIVIGVALTAVNLTMLISLCRQFQATEWAILKRASARDKTEYRIQEPE